MQNKSLSLDQKIRLPTIEMLLKVRKRVLKKNFDMTIVRQSIAFSYLTLEYT